MNFNSPHVRWSPHFYIAMLGLATVAFWPGYLAVPKLERSGWTHFHAVTGTLWLSVLIVQPWAILNGRRELHVWVGRMSYLLAPLVLVGFVGLAHSSMQGKTPQGQAVDAYFFYIRLVLVAIFVGCYVMGVLHRKDPEVHSRYMLCTGLTLIDPVVHRITQRLMGGADLNYQMFTFGIACAILAFLIAVAKHSPAGCRALGGVLVAFIVAGLPLALNFHTWGTTWTLWKSLSTQFAALPLT